jgi:long-chain acyl-CoA synthetase
MNLSERLAKAMTLEPEGPAVEFESKWYSWKYLQVIVETIDRELTRAGLGAGAPIGVMVRNRPAHVGALLALLATRRCVVSINPFVDPSKVARDILQLRLPALIADDDDWQQPEVRAAAKELGLIGIALRKDGPEGAVAVAEFSTLGAGPHREPMPGTAIEMLTSGTTGEPKRVKLAYQSLQEAMVDGLRSEGAKGDMVLKRSPAILFSPLVHVSGIFAFCLSMFEPRPLALLEKFTVEGWRAAVVRHRPKFAGLLPPAIRMILDAKVPKEDLSSLLAVRSGAAPLDLPTHKAFEEIYGVPILINYGATEFAGAATGWTLPEYRKHRAEKIGSVGKARAGVQLRVVDRTSGAELPHGEIGVLEIFAERLGSESGWTRTTDLASIDGDGYLFLHGRADDAIIRGGFKVLPEQVADALRNFPGVKDVVVVALPDPRLGQVPAAALEMWPGTPHPDEAALREHARKHLTSYQVPTRFLVADELPRTPSMKVKLVDVRAMFQP